MAQKKKNCDFYGLRYEKGNNALRVHDSQSVRGQQFTDIYFWCSKIPRHVHDGYCYPGSKYFVILYLNIYISDRLSNKTKQLI